MNIATLTIEMAANIARLQQDMERGRGVVERNAKAMQQAAEAVGNAIGLIAAGFSLSKFITETAGAQDQQVQLAAVLKSTGEAAGWSIGKLNDMAATLADKSKFSAGAIGEAQTRLLSYTGVAGKEFPRAMQNVIDMAQRMGTDVKSAAETVGRALDIPSQGLTALSKQGFRFTEEQKDMVKQLEETGKVGEAQAVIFEAMESSYAGAAEAARHTLGGALVQLQDNINDLMTGGDGSVNGLSAMVETLAASVRDADDIIKAMGDDSSTASGQMGALQVVQEALATIFETVVALGANVMHVLRGVGREIGGLAAQAAAAAQLDFDSVAAIRQEMINDGEAARKEIDATTARILGAREAAKKAREESARNAQTPDVDDATIKAAQAAAAIASKKAADDARALKAAHDASAAAAKKAATEALKLIEDGAKLTASLLAADSGLSGDFAKKWEQLNAAYRAGAVSLADLTKAQAKLLDDQPAMKAAADARKKQIEEEAAAWAGVRTAMLAYGRAQEQVTQSLMDGNQSLRDEIELIGLTAQQQVRVLQQRAETVILIKQATLAEMQRANALKQHMSREEIALAAEIEQLKERNELLGDKSLREAVATSDKQLADDLANNIKAYDDIFRTGFADMLNRGEDGIKAFGKSLKTTVMTSIADAIYRALAQRFVVNIVGNVLGMGGGVAGGAAGGSGALGMAGNAASLFGAGASAFGVGASYGATSLFANGLTSTLAAGGQMIGAGSVMSGIGTIAGALGPIALGVAAVMAIVKSLDDSGTMHTGALSQYSAAGGVANSTTHGAFGMGFGGVDYSAETEKFTGAIAQSIVQMLDSTAATFGKEAGYKAATAFADDTSKDGAWGGLLISKLEETIVNWDPTRTSKWAPREFADGAAGKEQYLAAVATDVRAALESIGLPAWATGMLDKLGQGASLEQLAGAVDQINAAKAAFAGFAQYMPTFAGMADSALAALVTASGGVAALAGNMAVFVDGFYTDAEKLAVNTENVRAALAAAGFEMPKTRDEFRALLEQQLALGDSGAKGAAALLSVNAAFASVTPSLEDAAAAAAAISQAALDAAAAQKQLLAQYRPMDVAGATKQIADAGVTVDVQKMLALGSQGFRGAMADYISTLTDTTDVGVQQMIATLGELTPAFGLLISAAETAEAALKTRTAQDINLATAQGSLTKASALRYEMDTKGMSDAEKAAFDYNAAITEQIAAFNSAGIKAEEFSNTFLDVILGRKDAEEAGNALATMVTNGVYNAIAGSFASQLAELMMTSLITPVIQAAITGTSVSAAVSSGAISGMVAAAKNAAAVLNEIFSNEDFRGAMEEISNGIKGATAEMVVPVVALAPAAVTAAAAVSNLGDALGRFGDGLKLRADVFDDESYAWYGRDKKPLLKTKSTIDVDGWSNGVGFDGLGSPLDSVDKVGNVKVSEFLKEGIASVNQYFARAWGAVNLELEQYNKLIAETNEDARHVYDARKHDIDQSVAALNEQMNGPQFQYVHESFLNKGTEAFKQFFADLGTFGVELQEELAKAAEGSVGASLNLVAVAKYFSDMALNP